jgi:hypothetical protein
MPKQKRQQGCWRYRIRDGILPKNYYTPVDTFCQEEKPKHFRDWAEAKSRKKSQNTHPYKTRVGAPAQNGRRKVKNRSL